MFTAFAFFLCMIWYLLQIKFNGKAVCSLRPYKSTVFFVHQICITEHGIRRKLNWNRRKNTAKSNVANYPSINQGKWKQVIHVINFLKLRLQIEGLQIESDSINKNRKLFPCIRLSKTATMTSSQRMISSGKSFTETEGEKLLHKISWVL